MIGRLPLVVGLHLGLAAERRTGPPAVVFAAEPADVMREFIAIRHVLDAWPEPQPPRSGEFYEPDGRLLHQYDRGPRRSSHRICRGRP